MAGRKALELSIQIAGRIDKSLSASIRTAQGMAETLAGTVSRVGTVGLAVLGSTAAGTVAALVSCTSEAKKFEAEMAPVARYVDGLADASGKISNALAGNGKTFQENYGALAAYIQDLSTEIPRTTAQLTEMSAALGQSGKDVEAQLNTGILRDTAVAATAMDLEDQLAGSYMAKWEEAFGTTHSGIMTLMDQINYLGANMPTTAADIAHAVNVSASIGQMAGVDPAATAAIAAAMQAMGVDTERSGTSVKNIYTYITKGDSASAAQKRVWSELGFDAADIARRMQENGIGTLQDVFGAVGQLSKDRQLSAVSTLFGLRAEEGAAKIAGNMSVLQKALNAVQNSDKYTGSMQREFIIQAGTSESVGMMAKNSVTALKQELGKAFLPVQKQWALTVTDWANRLRKDMPQLITLTETLAGLAEKGLGKLGDALERAMPGIQKGLDYLINNGERAAKTIGGLATAFAAMKFAPGAVNFLSGARYLMLGAGSMAQGYGAGRYAAGGQKKKGGLLASLWQSGQRMGESAWQIWNIGMEAAEMTGGGLRERAKLRTTGMLVGLMNAGGLTSGNIQQRDKAYYNITRTVNSVRENGIFGSVWNAVKNTAAGKYFGGVSAAGKAVGNAVGGLSAQAGTVIPAGAFAVHTSGLLSKLPFGLGDVVSAGGGLLGKIIAPAAASFGKLLLGGLPILGAISGAIGLVSLLGDKLDGIRGIVERVFGKQGAQVFDGFVDKLRGVKDFVYGMFEKDGVSKALTPMRSWIAENFGEGAGNVFGGLEQILQGAANAIGRLVEFSTGTVKPLLGKLFDFASQKALPALAKAWTDAAPHIGSTLESVGGAIVTVLESVGDVAAAVWPVAEPVLTLMVQGIAWGAPYAAKAIMGVGKAIQFVTNLARGAVRVILDIPGIIGAAVSGGWESFVQSNQEIRDTSVETLRDIGAFVQDVVHGDWNKAWSDARKIVSDAFRGLAEVVSAPIRAVVDAVESAWNRAKSALGLGSGASKTNSSAFQAAMESRAQTAGGVLAPVGSSYLDGLPAYGGIANYKLHVQAGGKSRVPMLADGGFTHGISIAGEAGTEAVISFARNARERNIDVWAKAGQMLGVGRRALPHINSRQVTLEDTSEAVHTARGMAVTVNFAPVVNIQGNADEDTVDRALRESEARLKRELAADFDRMYEAMMRRKKRVAL